MTENTVRQPTPMHDFGPDDIEFDDEPIRVVPIAPAEQGIRISTTLRGDDATAFIAYARTHGLTLSQALANAARAAVDADRVARTR